MMKKHIVLTLLLSLFGMNISVQAMQGGGQEMHQQCPICRDEEDDEDDIEGACAHTFHAGCLVDHIQHAYLNDDNNFDQLRCPNFHSNPICPRVLTREEIDNLTYGNTAILALFDQRVAERAIPQVINRPLPNLNL